MFERYQTVRLHLLGHDNAAIEVSINRKESTVNTYLRQYRKQELNGLQMKFSPDPTEQLSKEQNRIPNTEFAADIVSNELKCHALIFK